MKKSAQLPLMNVRDVVVYPGMRISLMIGREFSVQAIQRAKAKHRGRVLVVTQKSVEKEKAATSAEMFSVGVVCRIIQSIALTDGTMKVQLEGIQPIRLKQVIMMDGVRFGQADLLPAPKTRAKKMDRQVREDFLELLIRWNPRIAFAEEFTQFDQIKQETRFDRFLNLALQLSSGFAMKDFDHLHWTKYVRHASTINYRTRKRQKLLEISEPDRQFLALRKILRSEITPSP